MTADTEPTTPEFTVGKLARKDIVRYARHPLFLVGLVLTAVPAILGPPERTSSVLEVIAPAAGVGVFGLIVMASLVRSSDQVAEAAGTVVVDERSRTLALAASIVVPFTAGLMWFAWAVWAYHQYPPPPNGPVFGGVGDGWVYASIFALSVMACIGGPVLGLVVGRWLHFRGAAPVVAVLLVIVTIMLQGIFEPLRYIRVIAPWTYFSGPFGVEGDGDRMMILTGSPQWYVAYLAALCVTGVIVALLHDRENRRNGLFAALAVVVVLAAVFCVLAMTTGMQPAMINPLESSAP
jgi:hypothetical protein